jgi:hypothetical protein
MMTWGEFASEAPTLAAAGEELFGAFTLAFVATIRADGWPRVHPMTITVYDGGLYVFPVHSTPKAQDFERDGRYALHAFPHLPDRTLDSYVDDEFTCAGRGVRVEERALRDAIIAVHNDNVAAEDSLFRLDLDRAHHKTRVRGRAVYTRWSTPSR